MYGNVTRIWSHPMLVRMGMGTGGRLMKQAIFCCSVKGQWPLCFVVMREMAECQRQLNNDDAE